MSIGVIVMPTDYGAPPQDVARVLEDYGFESCFFPEHTHIPWSRLSPFPPEGELPHAYWRNLDPFVAIGISVAATERLIFGTAVCLIAQRDPIVTAKTIATLDHLSGGRIEVGVGAGWNVEEMRNHRVDPERRWRVVREHVQAMKTLWTRTEASFDGAYVSFERIASWPKPLRSGGVPILIGGDSAYTAARLANYGDGWIPVLDGDLLKLIHRIREVEAELAARDLPPPRTTVGYGFRRDVERGELQQLESAGVSRVLLSIDALPYDETVAAIAGHARVVRHYLSP